MARKTAATIDAPRDEATGDGEVSAFPRERFLKFCAALRIQSRDLGFAPFRLLGSQIYILDEICTGLSEGVSTFVILKSRQLGASTFFLALDLFWAFEHKGLLGVFATHEDGSRDQFRNQINLFLATLPSGYKVPDKQNNQNMLVLKNASLFRYLVAGKRASSSDLGRSGACNFMHRTEVAFWGAEKEIEALNQQYSEIYPHRMCIDESTANGYNHFETMWRIALRNPAQRAIFVGWWRDERNEFGANHPNYKHYMPEGVNTPLSEREVRGLKEVRETYGYRINAGQLAWYRYTLASKCHDDESMMDQEHPWMPDDAFQATGSIFFENASMGRAMKRAAKENELYAYRVVVPENFSDIAIVPLKQAALSRADLRIWEMPSPFGKYVIGMRAASGDGDETVISIFKVFADVAEQVAEYASDDISTRRSAWVTAYLAGLYKPMMWHIDVLGAGMSVLDELDEMKRNRQLLSGVDGDSMFNVLGRMRDFYFRSPDSLSGNVLRHWKSSLDTRRLLMDRFKNEVESDRARLRSLTCLEHMRKLVISDTENIEAAENYDDSRPTAAALAVNAWVKWALPKLRNDRWTYAHAMEVERMGGEDPVSGLLNRFMQMKKIAVRDDTEITISR